jgi:ABC-type proline/glycine betaine transport system permease subunit
MSAPFRIKHPQAGFQKVSTGNESVSQYFERLMKMIPGEVVGLYIVGSGLVPSENRWTLTIWTLFCLVAVVVVRAWGTADPTQQLGPQWTAVVISSVSFLIWVYSMGGPFAAYGIAVPYIGSLLVLAWTFFVPLVYKGAFE